MFKVHVVLLLGLTSGIFCQKNSLPGSSGSQYSPATYVSLFNISSLGQFRSIATSGGQNRIGDSAQIVFPQPQKSSFSKENMQKIPLHVLKALSSETDFAKVVGKYVQNADIVKIEETGEQILVGRMSGKPIQDSNGKKIVVSTVPLISTPLVTRQPARVSIQGGFRPPAQGEAMSERSGPTSRLGPPRAAPAKPLPVAVCRPEEQTVVVPVAFDPHIIYHPRCVRVERCGGCCGSDILACEPSEITTVDVHVRKLAYIGDGNNTNLEFREQEDVPVEKHIRCECRCRVKAKDCSPLQIYKEHECLCACKNEGAKAKCMNEPQKTWDPVKCDCECRELKDCNSGFLFDLRTCQCILIPSSQRKRRRIPGKKYT